MLLYHGTIGRDLPAILADGIKPRTPSSSNWPDLPSRSGHAYLTDSYPLFYAYAPSVRAQCFAAIVEIDAAQLESGLYPDEDFLGQEEALTLGITDPAQIRQLTDAVDVDANQHRWLESLGRLGTCAFKGVVPPTVIRRAALINLGAFNATIGFSSSMMLVGNAGRTLRTFPHFKLRLAAILSYIFDGPFPHPCDPPLSPGIQVLCRTGNGFAPCTPTF